MESKNTDRKNEEQGACEWDRHRVSTHVEPWMKNAAEQWYGVDCGKSFLVDGLVSVIAAHAPSEDAVSELVRAAKELDAALNRVIADPEYLSVFTVAQLHRGPYQGAKYEAEHLRLRAALAAVEKARKA